MPVARAHVSQGLASINTVLAQRHVSHTSLHHAAPSPPSTTLGSCFALQPLIVDAALNYLAASAAQRMGFVELYHYLRAYVDNQDKVTVCSAAVTAVLCQ